MINFMLCVLHHNKQIGIFKSKCVLADIFQSKMQNLHLPMKKTSEEGTQSETFPSIKLSSTLQQCQGHKTQSLRYCHKLGMVTKGKSRTGKGSKQAAGETGSLFSAFRCPGVTQDVSISGSWR